MPRCGGRVACYVAAVDSPVSLSIRSLAECPEAASVVASWHWNAWGVGLHARSEQDWQRTVSARAERNAIPFTLVGFVDTDPVGSISVCWDDSDDRFESEGPWVSGMVVRANARNLGFGRMLLTAAERLCLDLGHDRLWLHTSEAKRFYQRCGWRVEADKPGIGRDAVLSKRLD